MGLPMIAGALSAPAASMGVMIDHLGINCADLDAAKAFYDQVLGSLGFSRVMDFGVACGYGVEGDPAFWLSSYDDQPAAQREVHVAFKAADADAVHAFHEAAVAAGAEVLHAPRPWPEYHPGYYGVFVRDLDGNNVEAVTHTYVAAG
ncbi:VOC family protein [Pimelobacter sp. 30-1]|uniref:VOC family protein n=1 Tax=Pimelobacter sp. 30-1 TaxID=2004991 RepID=UPI0027E34CA5|nr:VOC family protein [Pimelobacter sp. 30-1]